MHNIDNNDLTVAKDLLAMAKPFVDPLVAVLVAPKLKVLKDYLEKKGIKSKTKSETIQKHFNQYLVDSYCSFCTMNTLVFPNRQIIIQDIYQQMHLVSYSTKEIKDIDLLNKNILNDVGRILISDTAGMGKSTLLKWIGATIIEKKYSIPILIDLKNLSSKYKIINEISTQLGDVFEDFDKEVIIYFIKQGNFVFLLDGLDEVSQANRISVIDDIQRFIKKAPNNKYILTSRPDDSLAAFGDFKRYYIAPLLLNESFELIHKLDMLNINKIEDRLIEDIKSKIEQVQEFLTNPLLVSLLYKTYTYNRDIPTRKSTFYDEIYGALYKYHDSTKALKRDKASGLDFQDFRTLLNRIAFDTIKIGQVEYTEMELIKLINDAVSKCTGINTKSMDYIDDLLSSVPLFVRDGGKIKWIHKSLQDYFAASYISYSTNKKEMIDKIYKSQKSRYINMLDFLFEMNYKFIRDIILYDIAKDFVLYCKNTYLDLEGISKESIQRRQNVTFGINHAFVYRSKFETDSDYNNDVRDEKDIQLLSSKLKIKRSEAHHRYEYYDGRLLESDSIHATSNIFAHEVMNSFVKKDCQILERIKKTGKKNSIAKFITSLTIDNVYILNDSKHNPLNNSKWFDLFTDMLNDYRVELGDLNAFLKINECIELKDLVESNTLTKEDDDLDGF